MLIAPVFASAAEVAVTLPPLAGLISMLDKEADVICLLANGADPHHFQLTPRKIEAVQKTSLLIRTSRDDGGWPLPPSHAHTLDLWPELDHGWLSPVAVRDALPLIAKSLVKLHPERQVAIEAALQDAVITTHAIEHEWRSALTAAKNSGVLMQHPAWRRLMQVMEVPILDVLETGQHGHEHGPRQLEHALHSLNEHPGAWLIADAGHNNRSLDWLQNHASVKLNRIHLNALGRCSQPWAELMQQNISQFNAGAGHSPASDTTAGYSENLHESEAYHGHEH